MLNWSLETILNDIQSIIEPLRRRHGEITIEISAPVELNNLNVLTISPVRFPKAKHIIIPTHYRNYICMLDSIRHYVEVLMREGAERYYGDNRHDLLSRAESEIYVRRNDMLRPQGVW